MTMPYRFWFYLIKTLPILCVILIVGNPRGTGNFIGLSVVALLILWKSKKRCPFCNATGSSSFDQEHGHYLACDTCGAIRGAGFLRLFLVADPLLHPKTDSAVESVTVDIGRMTCDSNRLNEAINPVTSWASKLQGDSRIQSPTQAVEIELKKNRLNAVTLMVKDFRGLILHDGNVLPHPEKITVSEMVTRLGQPYWRDEDDEEILLFYEFACGELQLEFAGKRNLSCINMIALPLMADENQREAYKVTAPWPPEN